VRKDIQWWARGSGNETGVQIGAQKPFEIRRKTYLSYDAMMDNSQESLGRAFGEKKPKQS
jgi:hypothetical protein